MIEAFILWELYKTNQTIDWDERSYRQRNFEAAVLTYMVVNFFITFFIWPVHAYSRLKVSTRSRNYKIAFWIGLACFILIPPLWGMYFIVGFGWAFGELVFFLWNNFDI